MDLILTIVVYGFATVLLIIAGLLGLALMALPFVMIWDNVERICTELLRD